ncbi:mannitol dehydrogenase family protein [uncultured Amphritea sp.]|uniref:mannitol dehydrogenase family protein n=1 Tax=uncultured Amphritea sp. TaxID=981605 RepID=UPI002638D95D|nr:mannitol dehydrogenase family protein [uncultured Amphritea sp.]
MKLNNSTLTQLDSRVHRPSYLRNMRKHGIVHIGVGGFHRSHEAVYTEQLLQKGDGNWAICGVGLRESDRAMQQALAQQDYLYTLMELDHQQETKVSVIGAISNFLFAPDSPAAVLEKLADPDVRIASLTITEGGYNVDDNTGEFNLNNPDIIHDLNNPASPCTVFGYLCEALARRKARGIKPFTVMSCDNLPHNGQVARKALLAFAQQSDPELYDWINIHVSFPNSMVDRITPMTIPEHTQWLADNYDIEDRWPVICEPFMQWVLEDDFCNGRPDWDTVGVQLTQDVTPYELMKIRLLNASHSAMGYLGYLAGYRYTNDVMNDRRFVSFIRNFMNNDVTPVLGNIPGVDIEAYKDTLIQRFSNQKMADQLARLCMDGSGKIPKFLTPTIQQCLSQGLPLHRLAFIIAGWAAYLRSQAVDAIQDPMAERLKVAVSQGSSISDAFLNLEDLFGSELIASDEFTQLFNTALTQIESQGVLDMLEALNAQAVQAEERQHV